MNPLVSVLVPVYNGGRFLEATLASIRAQTYPHLEIIVKDDGSTDDSVEIVERHACEDPRVRVVAGAPSGGAVPNHVALAHLATGEYAKFCHQDDLLDRRHVEALLAPMLADAGIVVCASVRALVDEHGRPAPSQASYAPLVTPSQAIPGDVLVRHILQTGLNQIGEPTVGLFRNGAVDPDAMFTFGERALTALLDLGLWFNLSLRGAMYYDTRPLSTYRSHSGSLMKQSATILYCPLEWLGMIDEAVRRGLLRRGQQLNQIGRVQLAYMDRIAQLLTQLGMVDPGELSAVYAQHTDSVERITGSRRPAGARR